MQPWPRMHPQCSCMLPAVRNIFISTGGGWQGDVGIDLRSSWCTEAPLPHLSASYGAWAILLSFRTAMCRCFHRGCVAGTALFCIYLSQKVPDGPHLRQGGELISFTMSSHSASSFPGVVRDLSCPTCHTPTKSLKKGNKVNNTDTSGWTGLHWMLATGRPHNLKQLSLMIWLS